MVYCVADCNQEMVHAMLEHVVWRYSGVDDWHIYTVQLMYDT